MAEYYNVFLDDCRKPLNDTRTWTVIKSYKEFVKIITDRGLPQFISFDHDLSTEHYKIGHVRAFTNEDYQSVKEKTGFHCAQWLVDYCMDKKLPLPDYQVHSMNPDGKKNIISLLESFKKHQKEENGE